MQPKRLVIKNFGPYVHETVDFDLFQETGLFLISGKTGSGKTTIFDSMSYALFGETSGQQRQGREMRSNFASVGEETSVTFLFEHQGFFYEILRKPEQELPKKRGSGMTSQAMQVQLTVFNPQMEELRQFKKKNEVSAEIQNLLHLDAKQFFQLILLPQGEFRTFLVADSKEKEKLLRHLFQTQIYQRLNDWLREQQKLAQGTLNEQVIRQSELAKRFVWQREEIPEASTLVERLTQWSEELLCQETLVAQLDEHWQAAKQQKATLTESIQQAKVMQAQLEEKRQLEETREQLDQLATHQAVLKQQLDQLDWVAEQKPMIDQWTQWQEAHHQTQEKLAEIQMTQQTLVQQMDEWQKQRSEATEKEARLQLAQGRLQQIAYQLPLVQLVAQTSKDLAQLEEQKVAIDKQLTALSQTQQELTEKLAHLSRDWVSDKSVFELERRSEQAKSWVHACELLKEEQHNLEQELIRVSSNQEVLSLQIKELTEQEQHIQADYLQAKSEFAQAMILRLQRDLLPDSPCPVCGSLEHPSIHPTSFVEEAHNVTVLEQAVQALEKRAHQVNAALVRAKSEREHVHLDRERLQNQLVRNQELSLQKAQEIVTLFDLSEPVSDGSAFATESLREFTEAQALQRTQEERKSEWQQESERLLVKEQQLAMERAQQVTTIDRLEEKRATALEQAGSVTQEDLELEQVNLEAEIQMLTNWLLADRQLGEQQRVSFASLTTSNQEKQEQLTQQAEKIEQLAASITAHLMKQSEVSTIDEVRSFFDQLVNRDILRQEIQTFVEKNQFVTQRLAELVNLSDTQQPDVTRLEEEAQRMEQQIEQLYTEYIQLQETLKTNQRLAEELTRQQEQYADQLTQLSELQQLAKVVNGENEDKLSLERYVLQQFLTEILEVATERFQRLSRGRYRFVIGDKVGSHRGKTGLEIDIFDDHTGETRRAQTLSGGESFIAALALALSLGDVIQARSGGITIDALFIDEGFGSLDEDALDVAIEALEMIEKEGRLIGIISHVRELKDRIGQQLLVTTRGNGTSFLEYR